jgi:cell division protein FtsQ
MTPHRQRVRRRRGPRPVRRRFRDRVRHALRILVFTGLILGGVGGLAAGGFYLWGFTQRSEFFRLREVTISGVSDETESEMRALLADLIVDDQTLFGVSPRVVKTRLAQHPRLDPRTVRVRRRWPGTLSIEAHERVPVAAVAGPRLMLVDSDGWIIDQGTAAVTAADVPLLSGVDPSNLLYGDRLSDPDAQMLLSWLGALEHHLPRMHRQLSELHVGPTGEVTAHLVGGAVIRLGDRGPLEVMPVLLSFTRVIESDLTTLALLDLRMQDHLVYRRVSAPSSTSPFPPRGGRGQGMGGG